MKAVVRTAGAEVVDDEVATDGDPTTSRSPDDLPALCQRSVRESARAPQTAAAGGGA